MKNPFISLVIILLFIVSPFVQSDTSDETQPDLFFYLPPIISQIAFYLRWVLVVILSINTILNFNKFRINFTFVNKSFFLFYLFPLMYALVTFTDLTRYLFILIFVFLVPISISIEYNKYSSFFNKWFTFSIIFLLAISYLVSFNSITSQVRFQGVFSNSNSYSISACFWLTILLVEKGKIKFNLLKKVLTLFLLISIFLSGSRIALLFSVFIILFHFISDIKNLLKIVIAFIIISYFAINNLNLDFVLDRFLNVANSAEESGRKEIWDSAFSYIQYNKMGYGMNAPDELLKTGNVHNCYIRFLITMGYPFTIAMMIIYFILICKLLFVKKIRIPKALIGFFIAYAFANSGEDYFAGLGSSMFIYILILIGITSSFIVLNQTNNGFKLNTNL